MLAENQLTALADLHGLLEGEGIDYWLFSGWAVDFHAGRITRPHDDLDIVVPATDYGRVCGLLVGARWTKAEAGDGYTAYARDGVRLELASAGESEWPAGAFSDDVKDLKGIRARGI